MEGRQPSHSEEIDLLYVFRPVGDLLTRIVRSIAYYFSILRANLILFFFIVLIISGLGFSLRYFVPATYDTQGLFASRLLPVAYCEIIAENLNSHGGEPVVGQMLHISPAAADDIKSIHLTPVKELPDAKDSALHGFTLMLNLKKMDSLDVIQRGLVGLYENNAYSLKRKDERRSSLLGLKSQIASKIASLDSVSRLVNSSIVPRSTGQGIILGQPIDPVNVYKAQLAYYKEESSIDSAMTNINNIEILQPFLPLSRPNYPHFNRLFLYSFFVGLVIALFLTPAWGRKPRVRAGSVPVI